MLSVFWTLKRIIKSAQNVRPRQRLLWAESPKPLGNKMSFLLKSVSSQTLIYLALHARHIRPILQ